MTIKESDKKCLIIPLMIIIIAKELGPANILLWLFAHI